MRRLLALASAALLIAAVVGSATAQVATPSVGSGSSEPGPAGCQVSPRSLTLAPTAGVASPMPGGPAAPDAGLMPPGPRADAATVAAITATLREFAACAMAGDRARALALVSDRYVRSFLARAGWTQPDLTAPAAALAIGLLGRTAHVHVLRHARLLADGRVAVVVVTDRQTLSRFIFAQTGGRWLIDDVTDIPTSGDKAGFAGNTYTDPVEGYGVAWGAAWKVASTSGADLTGDVVLDDGTSLVAFRWSLLGLENLRPVTNLDQCIAPPGLATLPPDKYDAQGAKPAVDPRGRPLSGRTTTTAFAVYEVTYQSPNGGPKVPYRFVVDCRLTGIGPKGPKFVQVTELIPAAAYDAERSVIRALLARLEF